MRIPTAEQQAIVQAAADGHDLIKVSAGAGTGKTSTTEMIVRVPYRRCGRQLYSTFGIAAGEDAARRLAGSGVVVRRPGQLAVAAADPWQKKRLDEPAVKSSAVAERIGVDERWVRANTMFNTAAAWTGAMRTTVVNFCRSADELILPLHVPPGVKGADVAEMVKASQWLWEKHLNGPEGMVNYTMDHCKKHWSLQCPKYKYGRIIIDEGQDTNPCDLHVYRNQDTQLIVIGDSQQQVYEWRGAIDALSDTALPGGIWLPLTGSFRFGPGIAARANDFLALLGAPFRLTGLGPPEQAGAHGNAVLCRTNAECMREAITALQEGKTVALAGNTRKELLSLARGAMALRNGRRSDHHALVNFRTWLDFCEYAKYDPDGHDYLTLVRLVTAHGEELVRWLERMTDGPADVTCATVWKAKGLQWPFVRCADDFWPGQDGSFNESLARFWLTGDRRNPFLRVCYVAVTRPQSGLDDQSISWLS